MKSEVAQFQKELCCFTLSSSVNFLSVFQLCFLVGFVVIFPPTHTPGEGAVHNKKQVVKIHRRYPNQKAKNCDWS